MSRKRDLPSSDNEDSDTEASTSTSVYDLHLIHAPKLSGLPLRAFTRAIEAPLLPNLIVPAILARSGFARFTEYHVRGPSCADPTPSNARMVLPPNPVASDKTAINFDTAKTTLMLADARYASLKPSGATKATSLDYFRAYSAGDITPVQVADAIIAQIHAHQELNAFIHVDEENIRQLAAASAARWASGEPLSILDGVPVSVKDETDCLPYPTGAGTELIQRKPTADATCIERLREAGAVFIGKTNMHELGFGITGHNIRHGPARNPYITGFHTGGSSAGSAASVACGINPISIGTDGGGSVRLPAAMCGVVGLKPTFGRVSRYGDLAVSASVLATGPLAESVMDALAAYVIIAGEDTIDRDASTLEPKERRVHLPKSIFNVKDLKGLRLGVFDDWFNDCASAVLKPCRAVLDGLVARGATIVPIEIRHLMAGRWAHAIIIMTELLDMLHKDYDKTKHRLTYESRCGFAVARRWTATDMVKSQHIRGDIMRAVNDLFLSVCDLIVTPTLAVLPPRIAEDALPDGELNSQMQARVMQYAFLANLTGNPAITVPAGFADVTEEVDGGKFLPAGIQFMAAHFREDLLFRCAFVTEQLVERKDPSLVVNVLPQK